MSEDDAKGDSCLETSWCRATCVWRNLHVTGGFFWVSD